MGETGTAGGGLGSYGPDLALVGRPSRTAVLAPAAVPVVGAAGPVLEGHAGSASRVGMSKRNYTRSPKQGLRPYRVRGRLASDGLVQSAFDPHSVARRCGHFAQGDTACVSPVQQQFAGG